MTVNPSFYSTFQYLKKPIKITLADGSLFNAIGSCTVIFSPSLPLINVLLVCFFLISLLTVNNLHVNNNCTAALTPFLCLFQDLNTKKVIGAGS